MKKIIVTLFSVLLAISANAQFTSSGSQGSFGKTTETKRFVSYIKASVSLNNFSYDKTMLDVAKQQGAIVANGSQVGYNAVYGFQYYVIENAGLYLGMEVGVGTRGFKMTAAETKKNYTYALYALTGSLLAHSAKATPLQIGYKFNFTNLIALDAHIGAVISYDFAGKSKATYYDGTHPTETTSRDIKDNKAYNRFDVGINPGATLWIGPVGVDFTYQRGLINVFKDEMLGGISKAFTSNFILGLAFRF